MIDRLLILRTCAADGGSHNGFRWPLTAGAVVECPDWDPDPQRDCGGGLHGLAWGYGDGSLLSWEPDARWLVVEVDLSAGAIASADKCRFARGTVLHVGDRYSATRYLQSEGAAGPVVGALQSAGDGGTATAGDYGTATAGDGGTATAGYRGTATAGDYGTATAGDYGTATAGGRGTIAVRYWDPIKRRYRIVSADVGEDGIEPGVAYGVRGGKLVRADGAA